MTQGTENVDHYVWEGFYVPDSWDDAQGNVLAVSKERAMELIADEADVPNAGWTKNDRATDPSYQLRRTVHHVVTVRRRPVFGGDNE